MAGQSGLTASDVEKAKEAITVLASIVGREQNDSTKAATSGSIAMSRQGGGEWAWP